jgi:hypothetical protein
MSDSRLLERIRGEYLEMPGLCLTLQQAQRLFGIERLACQEVLDALIEMKFLRLTAKGTYSRLASGADLLRRLHSVHTVQLKATLERRQLQNRRLAPRGGRRATDVESARHSKDNGLRTA